jgi:hypothetical protein
VATRGPPAPGQGTGRTGTRQAGGLSCRNIGCRTTLQPEFIADLSRAKGTDWGERPGANPARCAEQPWMRLLGFKPFVKGSMRGFATVQLPIGLVVEDCPQISKNELAAPAASPIIEREGGHSKLDGKVQYATIIQWRDRRPADRFSSDILELVQRHCPDKAAAEVS